MFKRHFSDIWLLRLSAPFRFGNINMRVHLDFGIDAQINKNNLYKPVLLNSVAQAWFLVKSCQDLVKISGSNPSLLSSLSRSLPFLFF